ncbi:hypothetical protein EJ08DRAFT_580854 [Tothia fuscella]|uniref:Uncharacterized protein n=1 Tax=Tothia fuscella TaxID=1048955 RepID=A0A9P4NZ85_9PEZI|nr:hypothetical protein EJ08DRAFT_580854 [Tothia fuscella]
MSLKQPKAATNATNHGQQTNTSNQNWLSSPGPYQETIKKAINLNPSLAKEDPRNIYTIPRLGNSRLVCLDLELTGAPNLDRLKQREFSNVIDLKVYLDSYHSSPLLQHRRVYIMEGLDPDFVQVIGSHFSIDPSFFLYQERHPRLEVWDRGNHRAIATPRLPSLSDPKQYVLQYPEMRNFNNELIYYRNVCARTGRPILTIGFEGRLDPISTICRKCSIWTTTHPDGSWDVIVLCDPPLQKVVEVKSSRTVKNLPGQLYQGGYLDFTQHDFSDTNIIRGPPRSGLLDDVCFYTKDLWETRRLSTALDSPIKFTVIVKKIVASEYMKLLDYFEGVVRKLRDSEWRLAGAGDYSNPKRAAAHEQWSSLHVCSHRMAEHIDDVEAILISLNISLVPPPPMDDEDWTACDRDFQYIYHRLKSLKDRTDCMVTSTIGLAGIVGNKQALREAELSLKEARRSIREAKSVKTLTVIAMFFIPLAWTSGLFSMSEQFSPGAKHFWIYFAVSIPLVLLVFVVVGLMQLGYDDSTVDWSLDTFIESFGRLRRKVVPKKDESGVSGKSTAFTSSSPMP